MRADQRLLSIESLGLVRRFMGVSNSTNSTKASDFCDLCFIKNLRFQASSPYFNGPELREQSIYQSKTSSCGVTGYPLVTSTIPFYLYVDFFALLKYSAVDDRIVDQLFQPASIYRFIFLCKHK